MEGGTGTGGRAEGGGGAWREGEEGTEAEGAEYEGKLVTVVMEASLRVEEGAGGSAESSVGIALEGGGWDWDRCEEDIPARVWKDRFRSGESRRPGEARRVGEPEGRASVKEVTVAIAGRGWGREERSVWAREVGWMFKGGCWG